MEKEIIDHDQQSPQKGSPNRQPPFSPATEQSASPSLQNSAIRRRPNQSPLIVVQPASLPQRSSVSRRGQDRSPSVHMVQPASQQLQNSESRLSQHQSWLEEMRGQLIVVAVLAASVTYASGLTPPGGFWQDNADQHVAGTSIMLEKCPMHYWMFYLANGMAFVMSLTIIMILIEENFHVREGKMRALTISTGANLFCLFLAFFAGSTRCHETPTYMILFIVLAFLYIIFATQLWRPAYKSAIDMHTASTKIVASLMSVVSIKSVASIKGVASKRSVVSIKSDASIKPRADQIITSP
ncbi:hypothetical protein LUZ60_000102 [Juncus effusus]|nr:hypothetical protein LUZ60_000102 [Juncus effusus]